VNAQETRELKGCWKPGWHSGRHANMPSSRRRCCGIGFGGAQGFAGPVCVSRGGCRKMIREGLQQFQIILRIGFVHGSFGWKGCPSTAPREWIGTLHPRSGPPVRVANLMRLDGSAESPARLMRREPSFIIRRISAEGVFDGLEEVTGNPPSASVSTARSA